MTLANITTVVWRETEAIPGSRLPTSSITQLTTYA
jgi:hypothetical protein